MSAPDGVTPAFLNVDQSRRAESLSLALALTAGRSVPIHLVWALARWIYAGEGPNA